jgi:hypothetical protein
VYENPQYYELRKKRESNHVYICRFCWHIKNPNKKKRTGTAKGETKGEGDGAGGAAAAGGAGGAAADLPRTQSLKTTSGESQLAPLAMPQAQPIRSQETVKQGTLKEALPNVGVIESPIPGWSTDGWSEQATMAYGDSDEKGKKIRMVEVGGEQTECGRASVWSDDVICQELEQNTKCRACKVSIVVPLIIFLGKPSINTKQ